MSRRWPGRTVPAALAVSGVTLALAALAPGAYRAEPQPCPTPAVPVIPTAPREYSEADVLAAIRAGRRP
jgi:hypothetical protein